MRKAKVYYKDFLAGSIAERDQEESALTINGKKNRLKKSDFDALANSLSIAELPLQSIYGRFSKIYDRWSDIIRFSFLSPEMQKKYRALIDNRMANLFS